MSDYVKNHSLAQDLPEYKDAIHEHKVNDGHFTRLLDEYEVLNKKIVRVEQGIEHMSDLEINSLKMERVALKDNLVLILKMVS